MVMTNGRTLAPGGLGSVLGILLTKTDLPIRKVAEIIVLISFHVFLEVEVVNFYTN